MFAFLTRRKAASLAAGAETAARDLSADARRQRIFDRTFMCPDIVVPAGKRPARDIFGLKPDA
ncbi:MAG: hypothetical protein WDN24_08085 [Sphingomonas sp.]